MLNDAKLLSKEFILINYYVLVNAGETEFSSIHYDKAKASIFNNSRDIVNSYAKYPVLSNFIN